MGNNNTRTIFIVQSSTSEPSARVSSSHINESQWASSDHQFIDLAANLTSESAYTPNIRPSPFIIILNYKPDTHFTIPQTVEG